MQCQGGKGAGWPFLLRGQAHWTLGLVASLISFSSIIAADTYAFLGGKFIAFGFLNFFGSVFGDLAKSMIQQNACFKDSGSLILGHGGILDKMDGYISQGYLHTLLSKSYYRSMQFEMEILIYG